MGGGNRQGDDLEIVTGINVTPLVDVVLVLLIVFMVTANFISEAGLKVNLPKAASGEAQATSALTVTLMLNGEILLMKQSVDMAGLLDNLKREAGLNPGLRVTLAADKGLPYGKVVELLDAIKRAGVVKVALAAER